MVFVNVSFGWGIHQMNLIDVKKQNKQWSWNSALSAVERMAYTRITVKCTVLSASENKLKFEIGVQYRCTYFCSVENLTHLVQRC